MGYTAAQTLIRAEADPHDAFDRFASSAVVVSSDLHDPDGFMTRRMMQIAEELDAWQRREEQHIGGGVHVRQRQDEPRHVDVMYDRESSLFDVLSPADTAFRRVSVPVGSDDPLEKPGAEHLREVRQEVNQSYHRSMSVDEGDHTVGGRILRHRPKRGSRTMREMMALLSNLQLLIAAQGPDYGDAETLREIMELTSEMVARAFMREPHQPGPQASSCVAPDVMVKIEDLIIDAVAEQAKKLGVPVSGHDGETVVPFRRRDQHPALRNI